MGCVCDYLLHYMPSVHLQMHLKPKLFQLMTLCYCVQRGHGDRGPRGGRGAGQGRPPAALPLHRREGEIFLA